MANEKRLIDANELKESIESKVYWSSYYPDDVMEYIDEAPTVDAVEVVRCKDCKYYTEQNGRCDHPCQEWDVECYDLWLEMKPADFCSYGERKDNDSTKD